MKFIKTTIIGGLIFMVPVVIVVAVVGKALKIMMLVAEPIDKLIPIESIGGVALANILALLAVVILCFVAGVIAKSSAAKKVYSSLDALLMAIPGYAFVKGITDSISSGEETAKSLQPVIVQFDDNAQIGFEVERLDTGKVVIYLPGAPNPWSGSVTYFDADRVKKLNLTMAQAISNIRVLGRGSATLEDQL